MKNSFPVTILLPTNYYKNYVDDPWVAAEDHQGPIIERRMETVLHEDSKLKVVLFGTIDGMLEHKRSGERIIVDHKTTSNVYDFYKRVKPNHQYTAYTLLARKNLNYDSHKFMVNALEVKAKPKTNRAQPPKFPRQITTRDANDYEEFTYTVVNLVKHFLEFNEQKKWPIGHADSCSMYGGCLYHDICTASPLIRENIIKATFGES